jgi:hypothetical protein
MRSTRRLQTEKRVNHGATSRDDCDDSSEVEDVAGREMVKHSVSHDCSSEQGEEATSR